MSENYEFVILKDEEFDDFEKQNKYGTFLQSKEQNSLLRKRDYETSLVGVKKNNVVVAAALVMKEKIKLGYVFSIDRGPLLDFSDNTLLSFFFNGFEKFAKENGGLYVEVRPNVTLQLTDDSGNPSGKIEHSSIEKMENIGYKHLPFVDGFTTAGSPEWEYVKDLSFSNDDEVETSYGKKTKYYLKKNKQFGLTLQKLKIEDLPEFKKLTQSTANRLHYKDKNLNFYETVFDEYGEDAYFVFSKLNFNDYIESQKDKILELNKTINKIKGQIEKYPNNKKFVNRLNEFEDQKSQHLKRIDTASKQQKSAGVDDVVVAGALFLIQPQEMNYLYSGTYEQYKEYYGPYQIQDYMIKKANSLGLKKYNFYGIAGKFDGTDGVLGFKTAFNGYARQLIGNFTKPVNPLKYSIYSFLKKVKAML